MTKKDYELVAAVLRYELDTAIGNDEAFGSRAIVAVIESFCHEFALENPRFDSEKFKRASGIGQELPRPWGTDTGYSRRVP